MRHRDREYRIMDYVRRIQHCSIRRAPVTKDVSAAPAVLLHAMRHLFESYTELYSHAKMEISQGSNADGTAYSLVY